MTFCAFRSLLLVLVSIRGVFSSSQMVDIPIALGLTIECSKTKQFYAQVLVILTVN